MGRAGPCRFVFVLLAVAGLSFGVWPGRTATAQARAQPEALLVEKAGEYLFQAGRFAEALEKFREVVERFDGPEDVILTARWNIARCYEEMGDDEAALEAFVVFAQHARSDEERREVAAKLAAIRQRLQATLSWDVVPAGAVVLLDGEEVGRAPTALRVSPGVHEVECRLEGFRPHRESVTLKPRESRTMHIVLEPMQGEVVVSSSGTVSRAVVQVDDGPPHEGALPMRFRVPAGSHRVVVRLADIAEPLVREVEVADQGEVHIEVQAPEVSHSLPVGRVVEAVPSGAARVAFEASLSVGGGFVRSAGQTLRTHVTIEAGARLRISGLEWLRPDLSVAMAPEYPAMVLVRPGLRWYAGTWPLFVRTAGQAMVVPTRAGGVLVGVGADIPVWRGLGLLVECDGSLWPSALSFVPVEFRVGVGYAF